MNLGDVTSTTVPKLTLVAPPRDGGSISTRTFIPHRVHDAIGVLGAVSVATAALLPDSPANRVLEGGRDGLGRGRAPDRHVRRLDRRHVRRRRDARGRAGRHHPHGAQADGRRRVPAPLLTGGLLMERDDPATAPEPPRPAPVHAAARRVRRALPHLRPRRHVPVRRRPGVHAARLRDRRLRTPAAAPRVVAGGVRAGQLPRHRQHGDGRRPRTAGRVATPAWR